jgi:hypothetical protein
LEVVFSGTVKFLWSKFSQFSGLFVPGFAQKSNTILRETGGNEEKPLLLFSGL